jgi:WD40 repeat protein
VRALAWTRNGKRVVSGSRDGALTAWDVEALATKKRR